MSADVSTVEPHGGTEQAAPVHRRRVLVAAAVVVVLVVAGLWWTQSSPQLAAGSQVGPTGGAEPVVETDPFAGPRVEVYRQTRSEAWTAWTVRNEGRYPVTLSSAAPTNPGPNVMPRDTLRFLPGLPTGGDPEGLSGPTPTGLQDSVTIQPGEEGFLVGEVFFPAQCLVVGDKRPAGTTYTWDTVAVDARVLGRTTTVVLPLPRRLATPTGLDQCPLAAFGGR